MDHHQHNNGGGGRSNHRGSGSRKNKSSNSAAAAEQQQRNNLLMEAAALSAASQSSRNQQQQQQQLAELFAAHQHAAQQQQLAHHIAALTNPNNNNNNASSNGSSSGQNNPLSLLQQQMNAIMQQAPQAPPTSSSSGNNSSSSAAAAAAAGNFNNNQAAWWYIEYLSRIQAAQMIPNLETQQQQQQQSSSSAASKSNKKAKEQLQQQQQAAAAQLQAVQLQQAAQAVAAQQAAVVAAAAAAASSSSTGPSNNSNKRGGNKRKQQPPQLVEEVKPTLISDPINLSGKRSHHSSKIPKMQPPEVTITPLLSNNDSTPPPPPPPPAHSTPINLSVYPGKQSAAAKEPPPAHASSNKPYLYTHMIAKYPQIGLIGNRKVSAETSSVSKGGGQKKKTVASLLAQTRSVTTPPLPLTPTSSLILPSSSGGEPPISYRPWLNDENQKLIIPNVSSRKEQPDYNLPLKMGWTRETVVKSLDDLIESSILDGSVVSYTTPTGVKCKSVNEIKKQLNQRTAELTPKHFSFNCNLFIGFFLINFESELIRLPASNDLKKLDPPGFITKLTNIKMKQELEREEIRLKLLKEEKEKEDKERKKQHMLLVKSLEICKKNKRRIKLQNERKLKKKLIEDQMEINKPKVNLNEDLDEFISDNLLKELKSLETCLKPQAFSSLLQIYEFLHTFGETLGFDMESLPNLECLLKGFINQQENEEELQSILIHLIVCAVEDPGMPNPTKHLTPFNQTLKQADVTFGSLSEILRIYLEGISDSEPEAETFANWLSEAPFTAHNPRRKTAIVAYLCDILLQNKAVLKHLENSSELIHNCKKERQQNDIKIRKLRMLCARKAVALACEEDETKDNDQPSSPAGSTTASTTTTAPTTIATTIAAAEEDEESSDGDAKLSIEEIRTKMTQLQNVNEKLKKQMHLNYKNIRTSCLGQDRFRRRYWNLPHSGGIFVEGGRSAEFDELKAQVRDKFAHLNEDDRIKDCKDAAKIIIVASSNNIKEEQESVKLEDVKLEDVKLEDVKVEVVEDAENIPPPTNNNNNSTVAVAAAPAVFSVPPPCIKIFSFLQKENLCSGKPPCLKKQGNNIKKEESGPTDDEILLSRITPEKWNHYFVLSEGDVPEFGSTLVEKGVREKGLKNSLHNLSFSKSVPQFEDTEVIDEDELDEIDLLPGVDPDLVYKIHLGLIETLETLEERVASASLQIKGWTLPLPRNLYSTASATPGSSGAAATMKQEEIIEIVKLRLLDLEQAVERRYLKPPLGKSANELNLSNLVGEDNANAVTNESSITNGPPCGSTSSTRGQQIQENNKLKELKEKEERMQAANESKNSCSRFLTHWRDAINKSSSPSVLSMAIYLLDSSIAWDKSVMKASCQLCKGGDNEDKLLLCDACDRGYHTYCFKPPLEQIPEGDWFCWECINKATGNRGCIVCGKGNLQGKKLLACDKCVKAYHTDCISPPLTKVPRGRWYCPDHQTSTPSGGAKHHHHHHHHYNSSSSSPNIHASTTSPSKSKKVSTPKQLVESVTPVAPPTTPVVVVSSSQVVAVTPPTIIESSPVAATPLTPPTSVKKKKHDMKWCEKILDDLDGHNESWPFREPVNTRQFPTYKKIIKTPMDLQTIRKSLYLGTYKSRDQFLSDVRLIFDNCLTFNEDESPVGNAGHILRKFFESITTSTSVSNSDNDSNNP